MRHLVANSCTKLNFYFSPYSGKFHLLVQDDHDKSKSHKLKYYAKECKSKVMFDVSSSHHQHSNQMRLNAKMVSEKNHFVIGGKIIGNFSRNIMRSGDTVDCLGPKQNCSSNLDCCSEVCKDGKCWDERCD